jgi:hypothetical protein
MAGLGAEVATKRAATSLRVVATKAPLAVAVVATIAGLVAYGHGRDQFATIPAVVAVAAVATDMVARRYLNSRPDGRTPAWAAGYEPRPGGSNSPAPAPSVSWPGQGLQARVDVHALVTLARTEPGQVWTVCLSGIDAAGQLYTAERVGPAGVLLDHWPVDRFQGDPFVMASPGTEWDLVSAPADPTAADRLAQLPTDQAVLVHHRVTHPAAVSVIVDGHPGQIETRDGVQGRWVGDTWVRFDQVAHVETA